MMYTSLFNLWNTTWDQTKQIASSMTVSGRNSYTHLKCSLWLPYDQVGIIAGGEGAFLVVKTTQLGGFSAEKPHHVRQLKASLPGWTPEQR